MEDFHIVLADGQRIAANLSILQEYSEYYRRGFSGNFVEGNQSHLETHANKYTVTKFVAVTQYLAALEAGASDATDLFPLHWRNEETWEELFELWLLADFLCALKVTNFVEEYLRDKARSPGDAHEALSLHEFNKYWTKLVPDYHQGLRQAMIFAIMSSPDFHNNRANRDALLDEIPASAERAIVHALMDNMADIRSAFSEVVVEIGDERESQWVWGWSGAFNTLKEMFGIYNDQPA